MAATLSGVRKGAYGQGDRTVVLRLSGKLIVVDEPGRVLVARGPVSVFMGISVAMLPDSLAVSALQRGRASPNPEAE